MDRQAARQSFEKGAAWALANLEGFSPDARFAVLAGLLLAEPQKAESVRCALRKPDEIRFAGIFKLLDLVSFGALKRHLEGQQKRAHAVFDVLERDPSPALESADLDSFRHVPDSLPQSVEAMQRIDGAATGAALLQASTGRLEGPTLAWLRRDDLWGYDLAHQILAWVVCLKAGGSKDEARERIGRLAWRLFHEVRQGPSDVHYDLFVERLAFLLLAGFPAERLETEIQHVLSAQRSDGGWWFTRTVKDHATMLDNAHLGASPLTRPPKSYRQEKDPEAARRRLDLLHRGHSTGLSLWALGYCL